MLHEEYANLIKPYIEGKATTCSYCDKLTPLIICESKFFYITVAIGAMVEGYVQLCAKQHRTAQTGVASYEREELELMKSVITDSYKEVYGVEGVAFEHGQAGCCMWGDNYEKNMVSFCHHMHIHYIPVEVDINYRIRQLFDEFYKVKDVYDMLKIRTEVLNAEQYLFFQPSYKNGFMYSVNGKETPRQFLRRCIANELGMPERAHWLEYPGIHNFETTKSKLQPIMQRIYNEKVSQ